MIITGEIYIEAPPERVFSVISDVERMYVFDPSVKNITITSKTKRGVGVKSHWVAEREGKIIEWDEEVIEYDPPRVFAFKVTTEWRRTEGRHTLIPEGTGTRLRLAENHIKGGEFYAQNAEERVAKALNRVKTWAEKDA